MKGASLRDRAVAPSASSPQAVSPVPASIPSAANRSLKESLARYLDPRAFTDKVPPSVKFTCKAVGKSMHDKLKARREIAMKRAETAIRFFSRPENRERLDRRASAIEAQRAETGTGSVRESAVAATSGETPAPDSTTAPSSTRCGLTQSPLANGVRAREDSSDG